MSNERRNHPAGTLPTHENAAPTRRHKKCALAASLMLSALIAAGCSGDGPAMVAATASAALGVDIIMPYATSTVTPTNTKISEALYIGSDGEVVLNDNSVLDASAKYTGDYGDGAIYSQLKRGDTSASVSDMQTRLAELGYYKGGISGIFDEETEDAVKLFESGYSIMQTGIATAALQEKMFSDDAMIYGSEKYNKTVESYYVRLEVDSTGSNVIALQRRLQELGYPIDEITGVYDNATRKAVRKFYKAYGYKPRDYAIVDLQKELFSESAKAYDPLAADVEPEATPDPNDYSLRMGDSGTRVSQMQLRLKELGYLSEATGEFDQATFDAVSAFQSACRQDADGVASEDLQRMLYAADAPKSGDIKQIYTLLQWGDSGEAVTALQERFSELGYYAGVIDGVFSDDMVAVVKRFQASAGLEETGVASIELQELAFSDTAPLSAARIAAQQEDAAAAQTVIMPLMNGDQGANVISLQSRLIELGFLTGATDGKFGGGTENSIKRFQKSLGVAETGVASADLINILMSSAAPESGTKYWDDTTDFFALEEGDDGDSVVRLQRRLWELGFLDKEDIADSIGEYGRDTSDAVNDAMKTLGCALRDGRASAEFQAYIFSDAAEEFLAPEKSE